MKPFLNGDEYRTTEFVVDTFRIGVGKRLHEKLKDRAIKQKNWVCKLSARSFSHIYAKDSFVENLSTVTTKVSNDLKVWDY